LSATTLQYGTNWLNQRYEEYLGQAGASALAPTIWAGLFNGLVSGSSLSEGTAGANIILNLATSISGGSLSPLSSPQPLNGSPNGTSVTNVPAYSWILIAIPSNVISMSFDYMIQGNWQTDSLAVALNGTNVLLIAGNEIQTNVAFNSGTINVSAFAGQTNEFFIGIIGGTSTNASIMVNNLQFYVALPPALQAQANDGNLLLSWPMTAQNFTLQSTTNLADANSWMTLTDFPAIIDFQNTVTNPPTGERGFYRLIQSQ
jgi:hypothetical protein